MGSSKSQYVIINLCEGDGWFVPLYHEEEEKDDEKEQVKKKTHHERTIREHKAFVKVERRGRILAVFRFTGGAQDVVRQVQGVIITGYSEQVSQSGRCQEC